MRLSIDILLGVAVAVLVVYAFYLSDERRLLLENEGALKRAVAWWTERCEKYQKAAHEAELKSAKRRKRVKR